MAFTYVDLFSGIGGFHAAMKHAGGRCLLYSEIDERARAVYRLNWAADEPAMIEDSDITLSAPPDGEVTLPQGIDVLTAGFPCQPFSKSGAQRGMDEARGTLFYNIARVLQERRPSVVMLENVRNIAGARHRHEWDVIIRTLRETGYRVSSSPTIFSPHLLPPELGGTPQVRERVFIMGTYVGDERTSEDPPPPVSLSAVGGWSPTAWNAEWVMDDGNPPGTELSVEDELAINIWDAFVRRYRRSHPEGLPGFPLWTAYWVAPSSLRALRYEEMPAWKRLIVDRNVNFYEANRRTVDSWLRAHPEFRELTQSRQKLEWQAGTLPSLWDTAMQVRPSGIRAKAPTYLPALVAITQTSIIGPRHRHLSPVETARLQGLVNFKFGDQRRALSYRQTGNAVAVGAVWHVFREHVLADADVLPSGLAAAVMSAPRNPCPGLLRPDAYTPHSRLRG